MLAAFAAATIMALVADPASDVVRLVRSTSGPRGSVQGSHYVIEDQRTTFQAGADHQVVVFFEWDAPPGGHECEASWREPSGKVVLKAPADCASRSSRFGTYWSLALPDSPRLGLWAVEVTMDGRPVGTHTFQITETSAVASSMPKAILGPKEIYSRASAATVTLIGLGAQGERLWKGSGFYGDAKHVVTAFQVVEGASSLLAVLPGGREIDASRVAVPGRETAGLRRRSRLVPGRVR